MAPKRFLNFKLGREETKKPTTQSITLKDGPGSPSINPPLPSPNPFLSSNEPSTTTSRATSRPPSLSGQSIHGGRPRTPNLGYLKNQVMVNYLYQQQGNKGWRSEKADPSEGVLLRVSRENYLSYPEEFSDTPLAASLKSLNVQVSLTNFKWRDVFY